MTGQSEETSSGEHLLGRFCGKSALELSILPRSCTVTYQSTDVIRRYVFVWHEPVYNTLRKDRQFRWDICAAKRRAPSLFLGTISEANREVAQSRVPLVHSHDCGSAVGAIGSCMHDRVATVELCSIVNVSLRELLEWLEKHCSKPF